MQRAKFSVGLADQVNSFVNSGFVLIRKSDRYTPAQTVKLGVVNDFILEHLRIRQSTWRYKLWRIFNHVDNSVKRHSLPLPMVSCISDVLHTTIGAIRPFLDTQLQANASMVELNSIISLPGSTQQEMHADIPFSENEVLISGFIALADLSVECGPTHLYSGTHTCLFHRTVPTVPMNTYYSSDGTPETVIDESGPMATPEETAAVKCARDAPPCYAQLSAGDILLFNTMIFHYGGANNSVLPRALLSFSFQNKGSTGRAEPINGFTYHCEDELQGAYVLQDFIDTSSTTGNLQQQQ
jgi:hypothetical protein